MDKDEIFLISDDCFYDKIAEVVGDSSGVYKIRCLDKNSNYKSIYRLLGEDKSGVIYIGSSKLLKHRCSEAKKACSAAYGEQGYTSLSPHQCGPKFNSERIKGRFHINEFA